MSPSIERIRTLIADDEKLSRNAIRGLLSRDCEIDIVGEAADGRPAIELIRRLHPQLVILEVQMPLMSGIEALREIASPERPEAIFVTADEQYYAQALELNAVDYLLKPFSDKQFHLALERAKLKLRRVPRLNGAHF
jgi:two-component system LytT family response regulator